MRRYQKIDIFRLFCAFLVVLIHVVEIRDGHPVAHMLIKCFAGQAVPYFFIVSGFFLAKNLAAAREPFEVVKKQVARNLLLYAAWMVIELPGMISAYRIRYPDASLFYYLVLMVRRICFAGQGVYWFILVMAEATLVCGFLLIKKKEKLLYTLAAIGLALGVIYDTGISVLGLGLLNKLFYAIFSWSNNVVMYGLPYFAIGIFFAKNEAHLNTTLRKLVAAYVIISTAAVAFFALVYGSRPELLGYVIPGGMQAVLLFLIARYPAERQVSQKLCIACRDLSCCLYYLHTIFIYQVADRTVGLYAPVLLRYAIAFLPPVFVWMIVRKLDWKPAKWMLSMK